MIRWTGKTTDMRFKYTAEGETYEELYNNIQEKYGYDNIIEQFKFNKVLLEKNGEDLADFGGDVHEELDYDKFQEWYTLDKLDALTDDDYRRMIEESDSQAYYHNFEVLEEDEE